MKIGPKHIFTNTENPKPNIENWSLTDIFKNAVVKPEAKSLANRIQIRQMSTEDRNLTMTVRQIAKEIPTPFLSNDMR